jgi:hypothetical protein
MMDNYVLEKCDLCKNGIPLLISLLSSNRMVEARRKRAQLINAEFCR